MLVALLLASACSSGTSQSASTSTPPPPVTAAAPTTTAKAVSSLTVSGVSPGVEQAGFYPPVTVTSVVCGPSGTGRYVALALPVGGPGTPAGSVLTEPTIAFVVAGKAVVKDFAGKVLYEEDMPSISVARRGSVVLSLTNITSQSGDGRAVADGAVNISGDYVCPASDTALPTG
jgi:hypothetical protein